MSLNPRHTCIHRSSSRTFLFCSLLLTALAIIFAGIGRTASSSIVESTSKSDGYGITDEVANQLTSPTQAQGQCVTPPAGMLAWYPGDGHNNDIQGGNNGVTNGSVPYAAGQVGQAFQFNGATGNAVTAPEQAAYQVTSLTIDAWINIAAFPSAGQGAGMIFFRGDSRPALDPYFLYSAPGGKVGFHIESATGTVVQITANAPANQWIHVAGTFDDPSNTIRLYVNGALMTQQTTTVVPMTNLTGANPGVGIGNIHVTPFSVPFNGLIDEVELFGRALTPAEIQGLYSAGVDGKCKPDADADGVTDALDACPATPSGTTVNAAGCPAGECFTPPANMVGWYPGDGNNNEIVGGNNGTTNGTVNFAAGEVNQAFQFSGATGNAVSAPEQLAYQVTSFSVDAWVRIAGFPSAGQGSGMIFFRGDSRPALDPYFLYSAPGGKVGFHIESATGTVVQIEANAPANQWIHLAGTFDDPSNTIRLYINGVLVAQQITSVVPMTNMTGANPGVGIGNIHVAPFSQPFNGLIDEVELFVGALTSAEVQGLYLAGAAGKCKPDADGDGVLDPFDACPATPSGTTVNAAGCISGQCFTPPAGMVAWYPGDGTTSDILGGHNPSATNAVSFVPGIVGQGFDFGPGGFIDIPNSAALNNQQFTVDAWARPDGPGPNNDGAGSVILQKNINVLSGIQTSLQLVWRGTDNRFVFNAYNVQVATASTFLTGQFYHVAGTYDGTRARIYVNGVLQGQVIQATTIVYDNSVPYTIGSNFSGFRNLGFPRTWDGVIDEVEMFSRALTPAEINAISLAGSAGKCKPDPDGDGVPYPIDNCPNTANADQANNDGDSEGDACDADDDNDGVMDGADNCPLVSNPDQANEDGDAQGDVCDPDDDNDTILDGADNCPLTANTDQANNDGDAQGDVCDPDDDNDTILDGADNCPLTANTDQANNDGDAQGDVCDADDDNDTILDAADNCPLTANTDQANNDGDAQGDVCDPDDDNDTILDGADNCPLTANTDQANNDGDAQGDVCDADDDNDGALDGADNCPLLANSDQTDTDSDGQGDACDTDDDNDGALDGADNCPLSANPNQANNDGDAQGDVCDPDDDNDTVPDGADNCPLSANTDQANSDGDGQGDVCDADDDNDTVLDGADNCPLTANPDQANSDGDTQGDVCDADDDNDTVPDGADNCRLTANTDQANFDNDGQGDACDPDDDNDGDPDTSDCHDTNPAIYSGATELCDGVDNNCNSQIDEGFADTDNDGQADCADSDDDADGVPDNADNCPLTANSDQADLDGDGQGNACDSDDDGDGNPDGADNCPLIANPDQADLDGDGQGNACDSDDDNDTVVDGADNCPLTANTDQANIDGDAQGDVCDPDDDNDGALDGADNCPLLGNSDQTDTDFDGQGDACDADDDGDGDTDGGADNCPLSANPDQANNDGDAQGDVCDPDDDNDTVLDGADNCPLTVNTNQANNDGDAQGDVCDPDDDNDTILDGADNCPLTANTDQANTDGDAQGDVCDPDDDNDTILDGADNCPLTPNTDQANNDGDSLGDVCDPDDDNDTILDAIDNCPLTANPDQADSDNDGIGNVCDGTGFVYNVCVLYDQNKLHKAGSTIPIKLRLCDAAGNNLSSPATTVTAIGIMKTSDNAFGPVEDSGNANPDSNFRYDATLGGPGGGYIFNLSTKGLSSGTYLLGFMAGNDPAIHTVQFKVK